MMNKKRIFLVLTPIALLLFAKPAFAGILSEIKNGFYYLPAWLFYAIAYATNGLANLMVKFFQWVITLSSLISYTRPADNPIIKAGFNVTLSFVNMILVMALITIALATILRLKEYDTKKLLVKFVIVALIVNFSPVICGLVVDASNIVTNYFVNKNGANSVADTIWNSTDTYCGYEAADKNNFTENDKTHVWGAKAVDGKAPGLGKVCADCMMQSIVYTLIAFIYLLFALLFLLRMFAIWILVILSPVAFACAVLPATQRFWKEWLDNFIKWCIIGITGGFFVWLGTYMAANTSTMSEAIKNGPGGKMDGVTLLPFIVPIIFLIIGFVYALNTGRAGASIVTSFVGGLATGVLSTAKSTAKGTVKGAGKQALNQTWGRFSSSEMGKKALSSMAGGTLGASTLRSSNNILAKGLGYVMTPFSAPASWAMRKAGAAGLRSRGAQAAKIKEMAEKYKKQYKDAEEMGTVLSNLGPMAHEEKMALSQAMLETKGGRALNNLSAEEQRKILELHMKYNPKKVDDFVEAMPQWIIADLDEDNKETREFKHSIREHMKLKPIAAGSGLDEQTKARYSGYLGEFVKKMPADSLKNISENMINGESEQSKMFMRSLIENGRASQISALAEGAGGKGTQYIEKALGKQLESTNELRAAENKEKFKDIGEYLKNTNKRLYDYFSTGPGKGLIKLPEENKSEEKKSENDTLEGGGGI